MSHDSRHPLVEPPKLTQISRCWRAKTSCTCWQCQLFVKSNTKHIQCLPQLLRHLRDRSSCNRTELVPKRYVQLENPWTAIATRPQLPSTRRSPSSQHRFKLQLVASTHHQRGSSRTPSDPCQTAVLKMTPSRAGLLAVICIHKTCCVWILLISTLQLSKWSLCIDKRQLLHGLWLTGSWILRVVERCEEVLEP